MRITRYLTAVAALTLLAACSDTKEKRDDIVTLEEAEEMFAESLTTADTTAVLDLGNSVLSTLQAGEIDKALDMLVELKGGALTKLSPESRSALASRFRIFPVVDYKLAGLEFSIPSLNDLKYEIAFSKPDKDGNVPTMKLMFNPVKTSEGWQLMVKQENQPAKDAANALHPHTPVGMK